MDDLFLFFSPSRVPSSLLFLILSPPFSLFLSLFLFLGFVSLIFLFSSYFIFSVSHFIYHAFIHAYFFITHRIAEVSSTTGKSLDTIRDRRWKHRRVYRLYFRKLCHRHHHHCHHLHSPIHMHCPVVVGRGAGFPNCSGSDA